MKTRSLNLVRFPSVLAWFGKTPRRLAAGVMLAAAVFAAPLQAQIVFDAGKDFSTNQNPNGAWSYGWWDASSRQFVSFTGLKRASEVYSSSRPQIWHWYVAGPGGQEAIPALGVSWNPTDHPENVVTMPLPPLGIHVHPGPNNENAVIRWTAPFSGLANIAVAFEGMNPGGTTTDAHVWHNGTVLYTSFVNGTGVISRVGFQGLVPVVAGDIIHFSVGYGSGGYFNDSTLLEAVVTLGPSVGLLFRQQGYDSVLEDDAILSVEVLRVGTNGLAVPITVDYATVDGTAHAGEDFTATSGTLAFAAGETNKLITIPILNDAQKESAEQFLLVLSNPTGGGWLVNSKAVVDIYDNDPGVHFLTENILVSEADGVVTVAVQRGDDLNLPFTVDYATVDSSAIAGADYSSTSGTLTFAAGETTKQTAITILDDTLAEHEEPFRLVLSNPTGGVSLGNSSVVIWIDSNDPMTYYVNVNNPNPVFPYASWATAATNIQAAVDVSRAGDEIVVTNGVYRTGSVDVNGLNRVALTTAVVLRSVNGPSVTLIEGAPGPTDYPEQSIRCIYVDDGALVSGFTLTNGVAWTYYGSGFTGGGAYCESLSVVTNCALTGNSSLAGDQWGGAYPYLGGGVYGGTLFDCTITGNSGGGANSSTLYDCTLTGNSAEELGGGANSSTLADCIIMGNTAPEGGGTAGGNLYNCVVTGNSADEAGGVTGAWYRIRNSYFYDPAQLRNCIVYFNQAPIDANYGFASFEYSCTTPLPPGFGNITNAPLFEDYPGGNLRLQSNSPCINAGLNAFVTKTPDLDGNPRIVSGTVDIGAYEFQGSGSTISYACLQRYSLPTDGSADSSDPDADGHNTWQEWRCGTSPVNALSALRLLSPSRTGTNVTLSWQSVAGVNYFLERSTDLWANPPFTPLATGIPGQPGTTTFTDPNALGVGPFFYRVGVAP